MDVRIIRDGQNTTPVVAATIRSGAQGNPLDVSLSGPSGEQIGFSARTGSYGRKNITTTPILILDSNPNRAGALVQNVDAQQVFLGLDASITPRVAGTCLRPIDSSSGDGGAKRWGRYKGPIYGVVASGDADVFYEEYTV